MEHTYYKRYKVLDRRPRVCILQTMVWLTTRRVINSENKGVCDIERAEYSKVYGG